MTVHRRTMSLETPRILIENSEYWLSNMGDLAMMEVTINRLRERWPEARIGVLTDTPHLLRAYFPQAEPIDCTASRAWTQPSPLARFCETAGPRAVGPFEIGRVTARAWLPQKMGSLRRKVSKAIRRAGIGDRRASDDRVVADSLDHGSHAARPLPPNTVRAAETTSLVLAMGGGYLTDIDASQTGRVLSLLELAHARGIPSAMVGQGLGPLNDPWLRSRFAAVLTGVHFIGLREGRRGPEVLARAGVSASRVAVTGDDAIELSYSVRGDDIGSGIGICLRVTDYSPVAKQLQGIVEFTLHTLARDFHASLVPIAIAEYRSQDRRSTLPLVRGFENVRPPLGRFARPQEVARQVSECRVLVTGAYHAAVFALAQGIPVVALSSSQYYNDKFEGLAEIFGGGLELVSLDGDGLADQLDTAIRSAWVSAPNVRASLRTSAESQIAASRAGLERACELLE